MVRRLAGGMAGRSPAAVVRQGQQDESHQRTSCIEVDSQPASFQGHRVAVGGRHHRRGPGGSVVLRRGARWTAAGLLLPVMTLSFPSSIVLTRRPRAHLVRSGRTIRGFASMTFYRRLVVLLQTANQLPINRERGRPGINHQQHLAAEARALGLLRRYAKPWVRRPARPQKWRSPMKAAQVGGPLPPVCHMCQCPRRNHRRRQVPLGGLLSWLLSWQHVLASSPSKQLVAAPCLPLGGCLHSRGLGGAPCRHSVGPLLSVCRLAPGKPSRYRRRRHRVLSCCTLFPSRRGPSPPCP